MEIVSLLAVVLFSMAVSLGVGSSTLAIINFFVAIRDGVIDPTERRMMGTVYIVLRVAMVLLFLTLAFMTANFSWNSSIETFTGLLACQWMVLTLLYVNAILMTLKLMPSKFGPAIQAGSWYTLGIITALSTADVLFNLLHYIVIYATIVIFAAIIINIIMNRLSARK